MDKETSGRDTAAKPLKQGRVALNVLAWCIMLSVLGRGLGESFTVFLNPISGDFGGALVTMFLEAQGRTELKVQAQERSLGDFPREPGSTCYLSFDPARAHVLKG